MRRRDKDPLNSWISISDLMAAILAVFVVFYITQLILVNKERKKYYKIIETLDTTKLSIIDKIKNDKNLDVNVDAKSGTVTLNSEILFESNDFKLKEAGKKFLKKFIPQYMEILLGNKEIKEHLDKIIIEGHTDKQGSYLYNLKLSQERALSVVEYINSEEMGNFPGKSEMQKYLTANGRSYIDYLGASGSTKDPKSRRVEFKFVLKETQAIDKLRDVFKEKINK